MALLSCTCVKLVPRGKVTCVRSHGWSVRAGRCKSPRSLNRAWIWPLVVKPSPKPPAHCSLFIRLPGAGQAQSWFLPYLLPHSQRQLPSRKKVPLAVWGWDASSVWPLTRSAASDVLRILRQHCGGWGLACPRSIKFG